MSNSPISASKLDNLLQTLVSKEKEIIDNVFTAFKGRESLDQFISSDLGKLFGIVAAYIDCFQSLQIKKRDELSSVLTKYYRAENIEERANQLLQVETEWDEMLNEIEQALFAEQQESPTVQVDMCAPLESSLINVKDGMKFTLKEYLQNMDCSHLLLILLRHFA